MLTNYHTHCNLCKHAGGTIEEYVLEAVDKGFDILGMSDHLPYKDVDYGYHIIRRKQMRGQIHDKQNTI